MRTLIATLAVICCAGVASPTVAHLWLDPFATLFGHWHPDRDALDFNIFYAAGHLVLHGEPDAIYTQAAVTATERAHGLGLVGRGQDLPYLNPPFFALTVSPLTTLPFPVAYQIWTAFSLALLGGLVWLTWGAMKALPLPWRLSLTIAMVTAVPVALTIQLGQFSLLLAASWLAAYRFFRSDHDERAGLALAPLLIKPELLVPIAAVLIWNRRLRAFRTLAPAAACAVLVSFGVVGLHEGLDYPRFLYQNASQNLPGNETSIMFGWNAILGSLLRERGGLETALALPFAGASLYAAVRCWKRALPAGRDALAARWLILTMATLLIDPHLYFQDVAVLVPVACVYVAAAPSGERRLAAVFFAVGWAILLFGLAPNRTWGFNAFAFFLGATFIGLVLRTMLRDGRAAAGSSADELPARGGYEDYEAA